MKAAHYKLVAPGLVLLSAMAFAQAQAAAGPGTRLAFDIHAKQMEEALTEFAQATQLQVLFQSEVVGKREAPAVSGDLTPEKALQELLADSGLRYEFVNARTVAIRQRTVSSLNGEDGESRSGGQASRASASGARSAAGSSRAAENSSTVMGPPDLTEASVAGKEGIPQVLIKGSRSLNADIERTRDDVRPYLVLDREAIEKTAARDVDELLRIKLPMNYVRQTNNATPGNGQISGNSSQIALRGLPGTETLILVDGRRTTTSMSVLSQAQSDLNGIPLSAIERIEVLPASASGIYGGSATGGVVNIVLRRDFTGLETTLNYKGSFEGGGGAKGVDIFTGFGSADGKTSLLISGSYLSTESLQAGDRDFIAEYRQRRQEDQISRIPSVYYNAANPIIGATTNVSSARVGATAPNLVLKTGQALNSPITHVPVGYAGVLSDGGAGLVANAGRYNVDLANSFQGNGGAHSDVLGGPKTGSVNVALRRQWTPRIDTFVELAASRSDQYFTTLPLTGRFSLSSQNAANPFRQNIVVSVPISPGLGPDGMVQTRSDKVRGLVGVNLRLGEEWSSALEYSYSKSENEQSAPSNVLASGAAAAVTGARINFFQDPSGYVAALAPFAVPDSTVEPVDSHFHDVSLRAAGPVISTRAGDAKVSLLVEQATQYYGPYVRRSFQANGSELVQRTTDGESEVRSVYAELTIPIASNEAPLLGIRSAEIQIAGRHDEYDLRAAFLQTPTDTRTQSAGQFSSSDPTVGLRFRPIQDFMIRGSYGTGFRPPYLSQLQESLPISQDASFLTDPKRGGEALGVVDFTTTGNPKLRPESSENTSAGVVFNPRFAPNLRLSFDWVRIDKEDNIILMEASQPTLNQEDLYPGLVTRATPAPGDPFGVGRIVGYDLSNRNATRARSDSYDFGIDYDFDLGRAGRFSVAAAATKLVHNLQQNVAGGPTFERAGFGAYPKWAGNATLTWTLRDFTAVLTGRYLDTYLINADGSVDAAQGSDHLPSQRYFDISAEYSFSGLSTGPLSALSSSRVRVGIKNVFDTQPRYFAQNTVMGTDFWDDPMQRSYFVSFRTSFGQ